jgi:hypothetical protein
MVKLPYLSIVQEVNRLLVKVGLATTPEEQTYYTELYLNFLAASGWTDEEYENATMERIDQSWTEPDESN